MIEIEWVVLGIQLGKATSREQHRKVNSIVMVMKELQSRSSKFPTATKWGQALSISSFKLARLHTCTRMEPALSHMITKTPVL